MTKSTKRGFTLIELLVVIAIIGILSSVVLASLNSARTKAKVAAFKSEVTARLPNLIVECDNSSTAPTLTNTSSTNWGTPSFTNCGTSGTGNFSVTANQNGGTCNASINEAGATFTGAGC